MSSATSSEAAGHQARRDVHEARAEEEDADHQQGAGQRAVRRGGAVGERADEGDAEAGDEGGQGGSEEHAGTACGGAPGRRGRHVGGRSLEVVLAAFRPLVKISTKSRRAANRVLADYSTGCSPRTRGTTNVSAAVTANHAARAR